MYFFNWIYKTVIATLQIAHHINAVDIFSTMRYWCKNGVYVNRSCLETVHFPLSGTVSFCPQRRANIPTGWIVSIVKQPHHDDIYIPPPLDKMADIFEDIYKCIFDEMFYISVRISLKFVPTGPIDNKSVLVQGMASGLTCGNPLPEPMLTNFTDVYVRHGRGGGGGGGG